MNNQLKFEDVDVVADYKARDYLQPPEQTLVNLISNQSNIAMLDIGVGAGRTTKYFQPLVKTYLGIDYSKRMIEACRERFPDVSFDVADIRTVEILELFDLILFSFNGIDCIGHNDRINVLKKMHSMLKHKGRLAFSSHNLLAISNYFKFDWAQVDDGAHGGGILNYNIHPGEQIIQLKQAGFHNIRLFDRSGNDITDPRECKDCWIYYIGTR
jgi:SAM-dependent methyltransferase